MMARGEHDRLFRRYKEMVIASCAFAGVGATIFAACNSLFIHVWTSGKILWPPLNDILLAAWIVLLTVIHCHSGFVLITKKVGAMRYVYLLEGLVFVALALFTVRIWGIAGLIAASIVCGIGGSGLYGVFRVAGYFKTTPSQVGFDWLLPTARILLFLVPVTFAVWWVTCPLLPVARLAILSGTCSVLGLFLLLRFGSFLSPELIGHLPIFATSWCLNSFFLWCERLSSSHGLNVSHGQSKLTAAPLQKKPRSRIFPRLRGWFLERWSRRLRVHVDR